MIYFFNTATAYFAITGCLYLSQTGCSELKCEASRKRPSKLHLVISAILAAVAFGASFFTLFVRRSLVQAYFNDFFYNSTGEKTFMKRMIFRDKFIVDEAHAGEGLEQLLHGQQSATQANRTQRKDPEATAERPDPVRQSLRRFQRAERVLPSDQMRQRLRHRRQAESGQGELPGQARQSAAPLEPP